jgi:hypothetical protein
MFINGFSASEPSLNERYCRLDNLLPFQSNLELHPLGGKLEGLFAVSLTHNYRITLTFMIKEKENLLK